MALRSQMPDGAQCILQETQKALPKINERHGIKVYFDMTVEQRLDAQLISNTNIDVALDLLDRFYERYSGPHLREWCQNAGLLKPGEDFAERRQWGAPFTVRYARTFIVNYYLGRAIDLKASGEIETTPEVCKTGIPSDALWENAKREHPDMWNDTNLLQAGREFARLQNAQAHSKSADSADYRDKANNRAVMSAWAYVAGMLQASPERLKRHYALADIQRTDPLNALQLEKAGKHKTDKDSYRAG